MRYQVGAAVGFPAYRVLSFPRFRPTGPLVLPIPDVPSGDEAVTAGSRTTQPRSHRLEWCGGPGYWFRLT
jgi:hypothetical protein